MRQIEDRWRPDINESNYMQIMKNLLAQYHFTQEDNNSIREYSINNAISVLTQKCSSSCLNAKDLQYNRCVGSCLSKYASAINQFHTLNRQFQDDFSAYKASGKENDFFKS